MSTRRRLQKGPAPLTLHQLAWNVDEIGRLIDIGRKARVEIQCLLDSLENGSENMANTGANHRLSQVKRLLQDIVKGFYRYRRTAATHVLVIMISTETRTKKPYALPIQCLPYRSLTDSEIWGLLNSVIKEMALLGMKVAGRHTSLVYTII